MHGTYIDEKMALKLKNCMRENLTYKRRKHIDGVSAEAVRLANRWNADSEKAETAALFHDIKRLPKQDNNLTHGPLGAELMEKEFGIKDEEILDAVRYHTTGRENMTLLDKIIFMADAIEPGRRHSGVEYLRKLAYEDLDKACLEALKNKITYIHSKELYLDESTALAARDLEEKIKHRGKINE